MSRERDRGDVLEVKVRDAVAVIMEHADAVQILTTYEDERGTHTIGKGAGNMHARVNMMRRFVIGKDAVDECESMEREGFLERTDDESF